MNRSSSNTPPRKVGPAVVVALLALAGGARTTAAQEPQLDNLRSQFHTGSLRLGMLLQTVADFQPTRAAPGENGFSIANFRMSLGGRLDGGFSYFVQTAFQSTPAMLDAQLSYRAHRHATVTVGLFKAPFSHEFLTSAASIDFVNRSQAASALAPGRQIGAQAQLHTAGGETGVAVGAFNGNRPGTNANDNAHFLYSVRGYTSLPVGNGDRSGTITLGVNAATSRDDAYTGGEGFFSSFAGRRTLVGTDLRLQLDGWLVASELIVADLAPAIGADRTVWGAHITAGRHVNDITQLLIRFDGLDPDTPAGRSDLLVLGVNLWPTGATEFQANYVVNLQEADLRQHRLLANFQIGF